MRMDVRVLAAALTVSAAGVLADEYGVAMLEISGAPPAMESGLSMFAETAPTVRWYVDTLYDASADDGLDALIVRMKDAELSTSDIEEIGQAIAWVREAGKTVYMFAENYGPGELLMGAYADEVIVQQGGSVMLPGLYMEEMYLADTLEWLGLDADFVQIGDYKGANEMMTRSSPSPAWEQNISGLLDAMYATMRETLKAGRGLDDAGLDRAMDKGWMADGATAIDAGLIDAEVDLTELMGHVEARAKEQGLPVESLAYRGELGGGEEAAMDMSNPFLVFSQLFQPTHRRTTGPTLAVLHINGAIVDGDSTPEGPFSSASVGSRTIRNAIKKIAADENIKGVVVRIDSPGGSAIASEIIWQGLTRLSEDKPVWVSVGSMAASGGYYILVSGDRVYVNPSSIVGSIGVVGGKVALGGLMDKAHIKVVPRARGPHAAMFSSVEGWDEQEMALIREKMTETYALFTDRVAQGRPGIDLSKTAEGRLFLGQDAVRLSMADEVGTLDDALEDLAADLALDEYEIMDFPEPPSLEEILSQAFGGMIRTPLGSAGLGERLAFLREVLGPRRFEALRDAFTMGMMLRSEPVLLTAPRVISFE
jgi:protease-4